VSRLPAIAAALLAAAAATVPVQPAVAAGAMSTASSDGTGASVLKGFAAALGHPVKAPSAELDPGSTANVLFVLAPETAFTATEAGRVRDWVVAGGTLVYCGTGDGNLDRALGLARTRPADVGNALATVPLFDDVNDVDLNGGTPFVAGAEQVVFMRDVDRGPEALVAAMGRGRLYALAGGDVFSNDLLHNSGNGALAADLIDLVPAAATVVFDEVHHPGGPAASGLGWAGTPWGAGILWAVFALFLALALRGRAFGPRVPLRASPDRSTAEYAGAVGRLLRRSRARAQTLQVLDLAARRAVAEQAGLRAGLPQDQLLDALSLRAPELGRRLAEAEAALAGASGDDERLRRVAADLHDLAHPPVGRIQTTEERS
jgi:hypothetical protein